MDKNSKELQTFSPYLSVVAASRNDDHGGDPLIRTQIFINTFARQCEKHRLPAELIIVDWNPVVGRPGLAAVLSVPPEAAYFRARVVTVPTALHQRLKYSEQLPLFQMIAKNVGIRRAKGDFILATNIDIIFSDELVRFIARQKLDPKKQYRVDRYDIKNGLVKDVGLDEALAHAWASPIRTNRRYQPEALQAHLYGEELFRQHCVPAPEFRYKQEGVAVVEEEGVWQLRPERSLNMSHLHTNACGDFTLLSREGWDAIRGYAEFAAYSFNIDSMGILAAHYAGYEEVSLLPPCVCFHIEHGIGSGWTPEGEKKLFNRLRDAGILNPEWPVLTPLVEEMREKSRALEFNHAHWGMAEFDLPEQAMGDTRPIPDDTLMQLAERALSREVSATQPAYDLDRLTLAYERRVQDVALSQDVAAVDAGAQRVTVYIPNGDGRYSEESSISRVVSLAQATTLVFRINFFPHEFPLRIDPCAHPGLVNIKSVSVVDGKSGQVVWELDGKNGGEVRAAGTAVIGKRRWFRNRNGAPALRVVSTGLDPQLILPTLPRNVGFPLMLSVEIDLVPSN